MSRFSITLNRWDEWCVTYAGTDTMPRWDLAGKTEAQAQDRLERWLSGELPEVPGYYFSLPDHD